MVSIVQTFVGIATVLVAVVALERARRHRASDVRRARLERLADEILRLVAEVATASEKWGQGAVLAAARARLKAAMVVAGGAAKWPQTDILLRQPNEAVDDQSEAALIEVTKAIADLG